MVIDTSLKDRGDVAEIQALEKKETFRFVFLKDAIRAKSMF